MIVPKRSREDFARMFECVTLGAHSVNTTLKKDELCYEDDGECDINEDV